MCNTIRGYILGTFSFVEKHLLLFHKGCRKVGKEVFFVLAHFLCSYFVKEEEREKTKLFYVNRVQQAQKGRKFFFQPGRSEDHNPSMHFCNFVFT